MNRNGNSANFFSYVCNGKKIKELFASTLNGITASVRCVSFIIVAVRWTKKDGENRKSPTRVQCFAN